MSPTQPPPITDNTSLEVDPRQHSLLGDGFTKDQSPDIITGFFLGANALVPSQLSNHVSLNDALSLDEYSLGANALGQNFGALSGVTKVLSTVPVRKPNNHMFVRVHPDEAYHAQVFILTMKDDGEHYLVSPKLYTALAQEVRVKMLYTGVTRDGHPFLWPVNMPGEDGRLDEWSQSAHMAAGMAKTHWVRLVANRSVGAYDVMQAANLAIEPNWPTQTFQELLNLAFRDKVINDPDHVILRRLRGEL